MTDVARLAACSQSTVSVVLNNTPGIRISKSTRERVIKVAEQLGYEIIPGHAALSDRPRQIAIVFDRIATSPEAVVSIDGQWDLALATGDRVEVRALAAPLRLIEPTGATPFYDLLRTKAARLPY